MTPVRPRVAAPRLPALRLTPMLMTAMLLAMLLVATACQSETAATASPSPAAGGPSCSYPVARQAARPVKPPAITDVPASGEVAVVLKTNEGDVTIAMDRAKTPCTVNSFESLVRQKYFDATSCHRLTTASILVLQCGDPTGTGSGGPGYSFADELTGHDSYPAGVVAMANSGKNTNGSQFFLVYGDSTGLDEQPNYTVFGRMDAASQAVVKKIADQGEDDSNGSGDGKPLNPAKIITATVG